MEIKIIKTEKDYQDALKYIENIVASGAKNSSEEEKLEVLITLVQDYESKMFPGDVPDPIDALEFVMEQRDLTQEDLVPYIGSRSKVSEVLSRKRPLSLNMIRVLHEGLGIPAKVLLNQPRSTTDEFDIKKFPIKEMLKRGYIEATSNLEEQIRLFFSPIPNIQNMNALLSRTFYVRSPRSMSQTSLNVWITKIIRKAQEQKVGKNFKLDYLSDEFLAKIVNLSDEENAIDKVKNELKSIGILLIAEPHMPLTYLDGAAIMLDNTNPIIGISGRHDRLDNFWFTLMHELAHIKLHYGKGINLFYDDIESVEDNDPREKEADNLAINIMIPQESWKDSPASILPSPEAANLLANRLSIHPAIVAGKMRYERKHYYFLNSLVGKGEVRKSFPEVNWQK